MVREVTGRDVLVGRLQRQKHQGSQCIVKSLGDPHV